MDIFPNVNEISVYDDSDIESYLKIKNKLPLNITFNIYKVDNDRIMIIEETKNKIIRIINEEIKKNF